MGSWLWKNKIKEILRIKNRLYKCGSCEIYTPPRDIYIESYTGDKLYFCCTKCKEKWIDNQLPPYLRKYSK